MRTPRGFDPTRLPRVLSAALPEGPDALGAWLNLGLLTRRVIGRRLEQGRTFATDDALDALRVLRRWTARRLVN